MGIFMTLNALGILVTSLIGLAAAWGMSRLMDRANQRLMKLDRFSAWKKALGKMESEPVSCAIYYAARWVGICLLVGLMMSRAI